MLNKKMTFIKHYFLFSIIFLNSFIFLMITGNTMGQSRIAFVGDYAISIEKGYNSDGYIRITDTKQGYDLYKSTDYIVDYENSSWVETHDLDSDGIDEAIIFASSGGSAGYYSVAIIDFKKSFKPVFDLTTTDPQNIFLIYDKVCHLKLELPCGSGSRAESFTYLLKYKNGKLSFEYRNLKNNINVNNLYSKIIEDIKYLKTLDHCNDWETSQIYRNKVEALVLYNVFMDNEDKAWNYFEYYYNCNDFYSLKKDIENYIDNITSSDYYIFRD